MDELLAIEDLRIDIPLPEGVLRPVRGVSLSLKRGETLAVVGESGSGKSLTALAAIGLLPRAAKVSAKRLDFCDESLLAMKPGQLRRLRGDRIALIPQDPMTALNPSFTIGNQLIETFREHRQASPAQAQERVATLLGKVGIAAPEVRMGQYSHQLSGGLRQRVMIAMALICEPDLLIADEPTTALDVTVQAQILELLVSLQRELGMGMIFITHDLGVVSRVADRVAIMYGGQVVETGSVDEVFAAPLHPYTEGLLMSIPTSGKAPRGTRLGTIQGIVPRQFGELGACAFAGRCPYAIDACRERPVGMQGTDGRRQFRCILPPSRPRAGREAWTGELDLAA